MTMLWVVVLLVSAASASNMGQQFFVKNSKLAAGNQHIWGGDMKLTDDQLASMSDDLGFRTARKDRRSRWPEGRIPFKISPELEPYREKIMAAVDIWNEDTCLDFYEDTTVSPNVPHLVLKATGTGCNSWVGIYNTTSTTQSVSLDIDGCAGSVSVILHELGHALGLWHEQDRPDRDQYLTLYLENVSPENKDAFSIDFSDVDNYGLPYDYGSIMQYSVDAMSGNGRLTLVPKDPLATAVMDSAEIPSFRDIKLVNLMYKCPEKCSDDNTECSNGGFLSWNEQKGCRCICPPGFGGDYCEEEVHKDSSCLFTITSPTTITSPNYPDKMTTNKGCAWLIKAPRNRKIQVKFRSFLLDQRDDTDGKCPWDSLRFRTGDFQNDDPGELYCADELQGKTLVSKQDMLLVLKTSKYDDGGKGFKASVKFV